MYLMRKRFTENISSSCYLTSNNAEKTIIRKKKSKAFAGVRIMDNLDKNIVNLVNSINEFPGLITVGSCGGHESPKDESQVGENEFYVQFIFGSGYPSKETWDSFHSLVQYLSECEWGDDAWVKVEVKVALMAGMFFIIRGYNVDPDEIFQTHRKIVYS